MTTTNGVVNLPVGIYLNVRQEPNFYSTILGNLAPKTNLDIIEQNGDWYKISYNNQIAFVFSSAVDVSSEVTQGGLYINLNIPNNFDIGGRLSQPTFNWNAQVTGIEQIAIMNASGVVQNGLYTSKGDCITIIKNDSSTGLTFIQYPDQSFNVYQQGWIESKFISSSYLTFRFNSYWTNKVANQKVSLFNNTLATTTLSENTSYTLLYSVSNYNTEYICILFNDANNMTQMGIVPFASGETDFILSNYPFDIPNESPVNNNSTLISPNAITTKEIELVDINGIMPYGYTENKKNIYPTLPPNTKISILQVFENLNPDQSATLIEYYNSGANKYFKGYVRTTALNNSISIGANTFTLNSTSSTFDVFDLSGKNIIYSITSSEIRQYLYSTEDYACILFENKNLLSITTAPHLQTGYIKLSDGTFSRKEPVMSQGFVTINNSTYYFNKYGVMAKGLQTIDNSVYFFNQNGIMQIGFQTINSKTYYFNQSGVMLTGWQWINNAWNYFKSNGAQLFNIQVINGETFQFSPTGGVITGWLNLNGNSYYTENGAAAAFNVTGLQVIDNITYFFNAQGIMQTGFQKTNGSTYYFNSSGAMLTGWQNIDGESYYFNSNGTMFTGWIFISSYWRYFNPENGQLLTGNQFVNSQFFSFDPNGCLYLGWQFYGGQTYYTQVVNGTPADLTGWQTIQGIGYYFKENGEMCTGWNYIDGYWRYFNPSNGWLLTGQQTINGFPYQFDDHGSLYTGFVTINSNTYYVGIVNGIPTDLTGLQKISDTTYYFNSSGVMQTGWQNINGESYYFNSNGTMFTGWISISNYWRYFSPKNGQLLTGNQFINSQFFSFDPNGALYLGWQFYGGQTYYTQVVNGTPADVTGWQTIQNISYYFKENGEMCTGWNYIDGYWRYFNPSNGWLLTGQQTINGFPYQFDDHGALYIGFVTINSNTYYVGIVNGVPADLTGTQVINSQTYNFNSNGVCQNPPS